MNEEQDYEGVHEMLGTGIGPEPPISGGPEAVFAGVRRVRRRRQSVAGAVSAVALLGVTAGVVATTWTRPSGPASVASGMHATSVVSLPTDAPTGILGRVTTSTSVQTAKSSQSVQSVPGCPPSPASPAPPPSGNTVPMDARSALELVKLLLPHGFTTSQYGGQDSPGTAYAGMAVNDGHGLAGVGVNTQFSGQWPTDASESCRQLPDGSTVAIGSLNGDKPVVGGYPSLGEFAERDWPDGTRIMIQAFNYYPDELRQHEKGWAATATRPTVVLTDAQLIAIASDGRWQPTVAASFASQARRDLVPYLDAS